MRDLGGSKKVDEARNVDAPVLTAPRRLPRYHQGRPRSSFTVYLRHFFHFMLSSINVFVRLNACSTEKIELVSDEIMIAFNVATVIVLGRYSIMTQLLFTQTPLCRPLPRVFTVYCRSHHSWPRFSYNPNAMSHTSSARSRCG